MNPLARKLSSFADLSSDDLAVIEDLSVDTQSFDARRDLIREGSRPEVVFLLIEGWAMRYKVLRNGARHIMAYLIPGDLCDPHVFILKEMDHSIGLLSRALVARIPKQKMLDAIEERPVIAKALWWSSMVDEGTLREWLVNIGQRNAHDRIAHLLAELWVRMSSVGLTSDNSFRLPLTQTDIGDTMGLTPVHVNRSLKLLRAEGLIELSGKELHIPDVQRLMNVSGFEAGYLHLHRREEKNGAQASPARQALHA